MNFSTKASSFRYYVTLMILSVVSSNATCQESLDSLKQELLGSRGEVRMTLLKKVIDHTRNDDPLEAIRYVRFLLKEAEAKKNKELETEAYVYLSDLYESTGDLPKAITNGNKALMLFGLLKDQVRETEMLMKIGNYMAFNGEYRAGLSHLQKARAIVDKKGYNELKGDLNRGFGIVYYYLEDFEKAKEHLIESLKVEEQLGDYDGVDHTNYNLALVHIKLKEFGEALTYLNKSLEYSKSKKDIASIGFVQFSFARLYVRMKSFQLAEKHAELALQYSNEIQSSYLKSSVMGLMPIITAAMGDFNEAVDQNDAFTKLIDSVNRAKVQGVRDDLELAHKNEISDLIAEHELEKAKLNNRYERLNSYATYGGIGAAVLFIILMLLLLTRSRAVNSSLQ